MLDINREHINQRALERVATERQMRHLAADLYKLANKPVTSMPRGHWWVKASFGFLFAGYGREISTILPPKPKGKGVEYKLY